MKGGQSIDLTSLLTAYDNQQISEVDARIGKGMGIYGECLEVCYASSEEEPGLLEAALPAAGAADLQQGQ